MKILYLTPGCFDKGGISRYSRYQINALRDIFSIEQIRVISLLGPQPDSFEDAFEVYWHDNSNNALSKLRYILKVTTQALMWRPNILHTAHVNFSGFAKILASLCGAKTVLNTYGLEVWSGLNRDAAFGLQQTDEVLSDCHFTANYLETEGFRPHGSTEVIWDCVDTVRYCPAPLDSAVLQRYGLPDPAKHFIIMTLGRLSFAAAHKGYDRLIKVFAKVAATYPMARLVIAGRGDMVDNLRQQAAELGVGHRVVFTGAVDEQDMPAIYRAAHVFSLVSDRGPGRGEGIPLTPLEAMSCGVPIIVGNHDGSQEAVINEENGFVIDPFDLDAHVACISTLINDRARCCKLAASATHIGKDVFSFDKFLEKHRMLYKKIALHKSSSVEK